MSTLPVSNITSFGARSGGEFSATHAIQSAIDDTHRRGGGVVVIPAGVWLTGSIRLRSQVHLEVAAGALLLGSANPADYPAHQPAYRSFHDARGFRALIYAEAAENIALFGGGTIDGQGGRFPFVRDEHDTRPRLLQFVSCQDVTVRDLTLQNSAMWLQHYLNCDRVRVRNLQIWNHCNHNNDMIDIDGSRDVSVSGCISDTDDDGITLKSTGLAPCENVVVSECTVSSRCNAIKCGSESTGGFRHITITDCVIRPSATTTGIYGHPEGISAVSLEIVDGGCLEHVTIARLQVEGTRSPLFIRLADRGRVHVAGAPRPRPGTLRQVLLQDITVRGAGAIGSSITGLPGVAIEDVRLERVSIETIAPPPSGPLPELPPELPQVYPEATMFGPLPASGLFVRHARRIHLHDVRFTAAPGDERPVLVTHDTESVQAECLKPMPHSDTAPVGSA